MGEPKLSQHHNFYRAFEDRYRGSRDLIASRLKAYLPFVEPLHALYPNSDVLDLGCGRGEWLELMQGLGFEALGVDMDEGMLNACRELNLPVKHGDAIGYLRSLPDESLSVVSAFHVVEHIPFETLQILVQEALRVLKPAGLLILETPNPENIRVGTVNFYLDPTHQKPIPPILLSFVPDYYGFHRTKVVRLQEENCLTDGRVSLLDVLGGVSPDYAVVAQKNGMKHALQHFDKVFSAKFGLMLEDLAMRYEEQINVRVVDAEKRANESEKRANESEKRANEIELRSKELIRQSEQLIQSIYASRSWRVTKPLRFAMRMLHSPREASKQVVQKAGRWVLSKPKLRNIGVKLAHELPSALNARLKRLVMGADVLAAFDLSADAILTLEQLTPRAQSIYQQFKTAHKER